ncbi:MAG: hypothetical protein PUC33_01305 [Oscillospiraceae bacterium]|nr:hypothetical protein [Oscillospiraceae bacterium]MDD6146243.1 hypothetical protein [Oscillospiraceae bacterium]
MANGNAMLETYSPGDMKSPDYECGIWVPICKPIEQNEYEAAEIVSTMMVTGILYMEKMLTPFTEMVKNTARKTG